MSRKLPFTLSLAALLSGVGTHWALTHSAGLTDKTRLVLPFIYLDVLLLLLLAIVIAKRLTELWLERRQGLAGSKLHVHIVTLFSLVAVTPAICVAVFSAGFFNSGIEAWFGKPVKDALHEAQVVADAYLREHQKAIKIDAHSLVNKLRPQVDTYLQDPVLFSQVLSDEADERGLGELLVFNGKGVVLARSYLTFALELEKILFADFDKVRNGEIVVREGKDRVRVLIKLDALSDTYLFVGKLIDPTVLSHLSQTQKAIHDYYQLAQQHSGAQLTFVVFFALIALLLLLAAIWAGLTLANGLVKPISRYVAAAEAVSQGDLSVKMEEEFLNNELDDLTRSFNHMTRRLQQQNQDLIISQRKSAWADVARKIAHEIKNPLTPIQLAAERLKRRYLKEITSDPQTFRNCIDTIIRQVGQIGSLVNEFSAFARMPEPKIAASNFTELAQQTFFLQKQAYSDIDFIFESSPNPIIWLCDTQQMSQVITNLLQNSVNALTEKNKDILDCRGKILLKLRLLEELSSNREAPKAQGTEVHLKHALKKRLYVQVEDNGPGFPKEGRDHLIEPYYTTREQGTGLGLAIVSKIVTDHNGQLYLGDSKLGGACVQLVFDEPE